MVSGRTNSNGTSGTTVPSVRGPLQRSQDSDPSSIGSFFGPSAPTNWNTDLWGNGRLANSCVDSSREPGRATGSRIMPGPTETIEGVSGSRCLLESSESDSWDARANIPWGVTGPEGTSFNPSGMNGTSRDSSPPHPSSSQQHTMIGAAQRTCLTRSGTASAIGTPPVVATGYSNKTPPRNDNTTLSSLGVRTVNGVFQPVACEPNTNDATSGSSVFFRQRPMAGLNAPTSRNSLTNLLPRSGHSSHSSFHSDPDGNEPGGSQDLARTLAQLNLEGNRSQAMQSQPSFVRQPHITQSPFSGRSAPFRPQFQQDEFPVPAFGNSSPVAFDMHQSLASSSRVERGMNSPVHESLRQANPAFYHGNMTPAATSRFPASPVTRASNHFRADILRLQNMHGQVEAPEFIPYNQMVNTRASPQQLHYPHYYPNTPGSYSTTQFSCMAGNNIPRNQFTPNEGSQAYRSPLLTSFRANHKTKRYELREIYNHISEFSGDQHGSRFIQQKLETANSDEKERVFQEIRPNALQLMTDVFGNYVIQKFFEHGNQAQKRALAQHMKGRIHNLSHQMYGCRVVQKALEHVLVDQQALIAKELEDNVLECVKDQNGNHVIQKAIERVPQAHIRFIINAFRDNIPQWAVHTYGCRVIQRMLEYCEEADRESILAELHACSSSLIPDQFGNYVIQHVIENGEQKDRERMIAVVMSQLVAFSKHKFASNVVEKTVEHGGEEIRSEIIRKFTSPNENGEMPLLGLMRDQYGNYVIQKVLQVLEGDEFETLACHIAPLLSELKKVSHSKQITAIEKLLPRRILAAISSTESVDDSDTMISTGGTPSSRGSIAHSTTTSIDDMIEQKPGTPEQH